MELSHDWIERDAAGRSGIDCADPSAWIQGVRVSQHYVTTPGGVYVPLLLVRDACILVDFLGHPVDIVLLIHDAGEAKQLGWLPGLPNAAATPAKEVCRG